MNAKQKSRLDYVTCRDFILEAAPGLEPGVKVLQTSALPLGYGAGWIGTRKQEAGIKAGNPTPVS